ncbi:MAG: hypothetical protein JJE25_12000 [Bacteroidia bacterium]|nr:hypothetical protein [Bacteroidia bacterium]
MQHFLTGKDIFSLLSLNKSMTLSTQRFLFFFLFGFFSLNSFAGSGSDTTASTRTSIFFSVDYRNSFITSTEAHVIGFRTGLELNNKFKLGVGYNYLTSEIVKTIQIESTRTNAQVRLRYGSVSAEYVLLSSELWQITAPLVLGFGESAFVPPANKYGITGKHFAMFVEPSVTIQYNIIPFIGIGTGFGYRFMPAGDSSLRSAFATPIYDFRIKLLMDEVIEAIFPND